MRDQVHEALARPNNVHKLRSAWLAGCALVGVACTKPACPTTPSGEMGLSPEEVHWYVLSSWSAFSGCWDQKPSANTSTVRMEVAISEQGEVQSAATIRSTFNDKTVDDCFADRMARLVFPARSRPTRVIVNLIFDAEHGYRPGAFR
jgi:hypothetical protein